MPYSINGYETRAQECVRLATLTNDENLKGELLKLRQTYLKVAQRLRELGGEKPN